ncbi:MAG TPA: sulfocyanin-like copper-binding protein [Candidatus Dormibacteraeota bacterium]|nr:sulfocyanin-like copper-binding protein [Candidatus Dormibacteraeota bacterium]
MRAQLLLAAIAAVLLTGACDPVTGTGPGSPPDPKQYLKVDAQARSVIVTLIAGYPATDYQFNYDGYRNGSLVLTVPLGWRVTIQCANHSTVAQSCAVVADGKATQPVQPDWSTPDPQHGLNPGQSASFTFTPATAADYRIASLVGGSEASGMWLEFKVVSSGTPAIKALDG